MHVCDHMFDARDLVGGHPVLDFINTVTARDQPEPVDWLASYESFLQWAALSARFSSHDLLALERRAKLDTAEATRALQDARQTRELLHAALAALLNTRDVLPAIRDALKDRWALACIRAVLVSRDGRIHTTQPIGKSGLGQLADALVTDAIHFFATLDRSRVRRCSGVHCGWFFVDVSKGGRRRWCDMATCGNSAKSRRHRQKKAGAGDPAAGAPAHTACPH